MTINKLDLLPSGVELLVLTAVESMICEDIMDDFVESTNLTNSEGKNLFPVPTWDLIHPNFAQVFGLKVAERLGKKAFLLDIGKLVPGMNVSTLVRLEGTAVLALSPGTLEARRALLKALKPSVLENYVPPLSEISVEKDITPVRTKVKTVKDNSPQVVSVTDTVTTVQIGEPKKTRKRKA